MVHQLWAGKALLQLDHISTIILVLFTSWEGYSNACVTYLGVFGYIMQSEFDVIQHVVSHITCKADFGCLNRQLVVSEN